MSVQHAGSATWTCIFGDRWWLSSGLLAWAAALDWLGTWWDAGERQRRARLMRVCPHRLSEAEPAENLGRQIGSVSWFPVTRWAPTAATGMGQDVPLTTGPGCWR